MKQIIKILIIVLFIFPINISSSDCSSNTISSCSDSFTAADTSSCSTQNSCNNIFGKTYYARRPQDSNTARKMMGTQDKIHLFGKDDIYGFVSAAVEYQQTFDTQGITKWFFFNGKNEMTYGNQCDGTFDIYAVNFGTTASGVIKALPKIRDYIADFSLNIFFDDFIKGLWINLTAPVVHTVWNLRIENTLKGAAGEKFPVNLVQENTTPDIPYANLVSAWIGDATFGDAPELLCGKNDDSTSDTKIAGITFDIGYDFILKPRGHFGLALHAVFPTGTRPNAEFLFNATVGTGQNWQLGGNLTTGYEFWRNCEETKSWSLFLDLTISHIFKVRQQRLFGLLIDGQSSPGSSWLLLKQFDADGDYVSLERAANILCCDTHIGADVMLDGALLLQFNYNCFSAGIGYNLWYRSKEKIRDVSCEIPSNTYGIKGTTDAGNNETQSKSTIGKCSKTDEETVFINSSDIDICSALHPQALSNKVFGFVSYIWDNDCYDWNPFFVLGAEIEYGNKDKAIDQWGIVAKIGLTF